eukprot:TRINITY_DN1054_c0_g1_i1.p1 TRINITY_DN1054_c0_g1~~TRINITY_DN1054_c0_g1_i1.p1  ORF type:complete len:369 (+),score=57.96 TRINITY_DN1054_c0_g1_i1:104-1210(+)
MAVAAGDGKNKRRLAHSFVAYQAALEPPRLRRRVALGGHVGHQTVAAAREEWLALAEQAKAVRLSRRRNREGEGEGEEDEHEEEEEEEEGDNIRVLVAGGVGAKFFGSAADEGAHCSFRLEANGNLWIIKVPTTREHGSICNKVGTQLGNYLDTLPAGISDLIDCQQATGMPTAAGGWREPDISMAPCFFQPGAAEVPRVIVEVEHCHRSPHMVRQDGHELLSAAPEVRALVSISFYRRRTPPAPAPQRFAAAAVMWENTPAGIVVSDAVSFGTDDLAPITRNQFAAAAFPGVAAPLLPPVPAAAGWRRAVRPAVYPRPVPPPGHVASIHIPAANILFNLWDPAAGAFVAIPAGLPDAVLDLWRIVPI